MVMCSDSTLLEPCQGVTWKVKGWVFWGQDTGTKREARWKLCFGRRKSNECMYCSGITQYGGFLFFFFLNFIFYNFNFFFSAKKLKFLMAGTKHKSLVQAQLRRLVQWKPAKIKDENNGVADYFGSSLTVHMQSFLFVVSQIVAE